MSEEKKINYMCNIIANKGIYDRYRIFMITIRDI